MDTSPQELVIPLAQEAHQSLSEIDAWITGNDQIQGTGVDKYPVGLLMMKIASEVQYFHADSYQMVKAPFLEHLAIVSAWVLSECHLSLNIFAVNYGFENMRETL